MGGKRGRLNVEKLERLVGVTKREVIERMVGGGKAKGKNAENWHGGLLM